MLLTLSKPCAHMRMRQRGGGQAQGKSWSEEAGAPPGGQQGMRIQLLKRCAAAAVRQDTTWCGTMTLVPYLVQDLGVPQCQQACGQAAHGGGQRRLKGVLLPKLVKGLCRGVAPGGVCV